MLGYRGPFSRYSEWHQFVVGLALGIAGDEADEVVVVAVAAALGESKNVPSRVLEELEAQPHYLAGGIVVGRLLQWRHDA